MQRALLIVIAAFFAMSVGAQTKTVFTIGPKIGHTFGENGGFTYGFEASFFPALKDPASDKFRYGFTFDATVSKAHTTFHLGAEIIGLCVGIDLGPTLLIDDYGSSVGVGTIIFLGAIVYPYYEVGHFAHVTVKSAGTYIKMPPKMWIGGDGWWALH